MESILFLIYYVIKALKLEKEKVSATMRALVSAEQFLFTLKYMPLRVHKQNNY